MTKWEYYVRTISLEQFNETEQLDREGASGWELISVDRTKSAYPKYIFKRPLPPEANHET